jgi:DNA-binding NtrC family response regulator
MRSPEIHEILLGHSAAIRKVRALIERVAPTELPVLISGPTGVGKELVATAIHAASGRKGKLVAFNVCAIPETMFEDALFGHVRGAFTGAVNSSLGYLREAHSGTAFLDEIGALTSAAQAKLLRAIETREFRPVGAAADVRSEFRLVAAANEDLWNLEQSGLFRADLAHRFSSFVIRVPSLRDRPEDIPMLASTFLREIAKHDVSICKDAMQLLARHHWPGNVRQLRHVIHSAATLSGSESIRIDDIREALSWMAPGIDAGPTGTNVDQRLLEVLEQCEWDTERAARELNVHRATIYRRLRRIGSPKLLQVSTGSERGSAGSDDAEMSTESA